MSITHGKQIWNYTSQSFGILFETVIRAINQFKPTFRHFKLKLSTSISTVYYFKLLNNDIKGLEISRS